MSFGNLTNNTPTDHYFNDVVESLRCFTGKLSLLGHINCVNFSFVTIHGTTLLKYILFVEGVLTKIVTLINVIITLGLGFCTCTHLNEMRLRKVAPSIVTSLCIHPPVLTPTVISHC